MLPTKLWQRSMSIARHHKKRVLPGQISPRRTVPSSIVRPPYAATGEAPQMETSVPILNEDEIGFMRESCQLAAKALEFAGSCVGVGVSTDEIDHQVHEFILEHQAYPSPLNYCKFPKSLCSSINEVVVHGIPDDRKLEDGDIVNLDVSVYKNGFHGDTSRTFLVGNVDEEGTKLVQSTKKALDKAITICKPGLPLSDIGLCIHQIADADGFSTVRNFTGHGVGRDFHHLPFILHYRNDYPGELLPGMVFTIEPMFCEGLHETVAWEDGWTMVTKDLGRSAQFEHSLLITEAGVEVLTAYE